MNFRLLLFLAVFSFRQSFSQDVAPAFKQSKDLPAFELQKADNSTFKSDKLKKNVPTAIIFFSPTCEHCQHQMEWMIKRMSDLKKYQFVMATYQPIEELVDFNKKYQLAKYPNFITGRDTKYFFPPFYQIRNFPFLAFYDKHGKLIDTNDGNMTIDNMLKKFNKRN
jgi:thiol-disulfide isomerase/thioredoxin